MRSLKLRWIFTLAVFAMTILIVGAVSSAAENPNAGCNQTPYENPSGNGANHSGGYDDTCDGSPSGNGNGNGNATGQPCAGCVGQADEKNPPGQAPDGSDSNNGYECDSNSGIAKTNPAHTGCEASANPPENPPPEENPPGSTPGAEVLGRKVLATTGVSTWALLATGLLFLAIGFGMRQLARRVDGSIASG